MKATLLSVCLLAACAAPADDTRSGVHGHGIDRGAIRAVATSSIATLRSLSEVPSATAAAFRDADEIDRAVPGAALPAGSSSYEL